MSARLLFEAFAPAGARSRLSILIFHRVRRTADPLFPEEPDADAFRSQMQWVKRWFNVLPLSEAVARLREGSLPARPVSITFDDGYADNCTVALPILRSLGLHATFFVATGFLNGGRMWNDTIIESIRAARGEALDLAGLDLGRFPLGSTAARREAIDRILPRVKYLPSPDRSRIAESIAQRAGAALPADLMLTDAQVRELAAAGMDIGAHTVTHPILRCLADREAQAEIEESRKHLQALVGQLVTLFAYPNGNPETDYAAVHVSMVRSAGFEAAVTTAAGAARSGSDPYQLPRFTPWDRSSFRYGIRLALNMRRPDHAAGRTGAQHGSMPQG